MGAGPVNGFLAVGYPDIKALSHIKMADEPSEYQPDMLNTVTQPWGPATANKMRDEATRLAALANFRDYLAAQPGPA